MTIAPMLWEGRTVRVVAIEGEPWFAGVDVATALGYANPSDAIGKHCKGVAKRYPLPTPGGPQDVRMLSEPDVMRLIVASRLPAAQRFERWVFEEVLPSIRRTGGYGNAVAALNDPATLRTLLLQYTDRVEALEQRLVAAEPDLQALERLAKAQGTLCLRDAALALGMPERQFTAALHQHGWIYRRPGTGTWYGYAYQVQRGRIDHKVYEQPGADGQPRIREQVRLTPKGLVDAARLLQAPAPSPSARAAAIANVEQLVGGAHAG